MAFNSMKSQQGSSSWIVAVVILILAIIGAAGYGLWRDNHKTSTPSQNNTQQNKQSVSSDPSSSSNGSTNTVSLAEACSQLSLSKGTSSGTAGTIYWHAVITNNGTHDCTLTGYPGAFMKDSQSTMASATDNPLYAPAAVMLAAHGGKAHVVLGIVNPGNLDPGSAVCTNASSTKLQLYLPGLETPLQGTFSEKVCNDFTVTALKAGP